MAAQQTTTTNTTTKSQDASKDNRAWRFRTGFIPNGCTIVSMLHTAVSTKDHMISR